MNLCSLLQLAFSVCVYVPYQYQEKGVWFQVSPFQPGWQESRQGSDKLRTSLHEESHCLNVSKKLYSKFSCIKASLTEPWMVFQSCSDYCYCIGFPVVCWKTWHHKGWKIDMTLLQIINVAYLVELTPDSFGLSFLIYFLLCFIPESGLPETSVTGLQHCLLSSHLQTKEEMRPK